MDKITYSGMMKERAGNGYPAAVFFGYPFARSNFYFLQECRKRGGCVILDLTGRCRNEEGFYKTKYPISSNPADYNVLEIIKEASGTEFLHECLMFKIKDISYTDLQDNVLYDISGYNGNWAAAAVGCLMRHEKCPVYILGMTKADTHDLSMIAKICEKTELCLNASFSDISCLTKDSRIVIGLSFQEIIAAGRHNIQYLTDDPAQITGNVAVLNANGLSEVCETEEKENSQETLLQSLISSMNRMCDICEKLAEQAGA